MVLMKMAWVLLWNFKHKKTIVAITAGINTTSAFQ